jgi:hypothetical protein
MVNRPALPIGNPPGLSPHQWNELCDAHRAGALALICWSRGDVCATFDMTIAQRLSDSRRSIPWDEIMFSHRTMVGPKAHLDLLSFWLPLPTADVARLPSIGAGRTPATG